MVLSFLFGLCNITRELISDGINFIIAAVFSTFLLTWSRKLLVKIATNYVGNTDFFYTHKETHVTLK